MEEDAQKLIFKVDVGFIYKHQQYVACLVDGPKAERDGGGGGGGGGELKVIFKDSS